MEVHRHYEVVQGGAKKELEPLSGLADLPPTVIDKILPWAVKICPRNFFNGRAHLLPSGPPPPRQLYFTFLDRFKDRCFRRFFLNWPQYGKNSRSVSASARYSTERAAANATSGRGDRGSGKPLRVLP